MKATIDLLSKSQIEDIASRYGTPVVLVYEEIIRERCRVLRNAFPDANFFYAIKANYNPWIISIIKEEGFGIDAVSPFELKFAMEMSFSRARIIYVENNMSDEDLHYILNGGVKVIVGSLSALEKYCLEANGRPVGLRVNCDIGASPHHYTFTAGPLSKFGIHYTDIERAVEIAAKHNVEVTTLQQHIGSNWLDKAPLVEAARLLMRLARPLPTVRTLDFGGGFGIPYLPSQKHIDFDQLSKELLAEIKAFQLETGRNFEICFEPGRFIVAESSVIITQVNDKKFGSAGRIFLGTDTGFGHLIRPALYQSYHHIVNISGSARQQELYDVCGNLCEDTDYIARDRSISKTKEGDLLAILDAGAYGLCQSTEYNLRQIPPEVLISKEKELLIRRRKSFEEMMSPFAYPFTS